MLSDVLANGKTGSGMDLIYCPYTNRDIPRSTSSSEHIIPLALGGVNGFLTEIDRDFNSRIGSALDGQLAKDFLWALRRAECDARGHSGKEPVATFRASYGEPQRPAQVQFRRGYRVRVWDARDQEYTRPGGTVEFNAHVSVHLPVRFTAKVALAAGHLVYGDLYRNDVEHQHLRAIVDMDPEKLAQIRGSEELRAEYTGVRCDDYLHEPQNDPRGVLKVLRAFCAAMNGSCVVLTLGDDCFAVTVGLLGRYLGMISVPATTDAFPREGDHDLGHVISLGEGKVKRCSLRDGLTGLKASLA